MNEDNICPNCEKLKQEMELESIKTGSLISTLQLTINQLNIRLEESRRKKEEGGESG